MPERKNFARVFSSTIHSFEEQDVPAPTHKSWSNNAACPAAWKRRSRCSIQPRRLRTRLSRRSFRTRSKLPIPVKTTRPAELPPLHAVTLCDSEILPSGLRAHSLE